MTTSIELRGAKIVAWVNKKTNKLITGDSFVVAQVEDKPGIYVTDFGIIDIKFGTVINGGGNPSPTILLDCSGIKLLQSRHNKGERVINIFHDSRYADRIGCQQLSDGVDLFISTDYFKP